MKKISLLLLMLMTGMIASAQFSTDAGISALTPSGVICDGANPVIATVTNYDPVNPTNGVVQVQWTIDGVPQAPVSTAGPLPGGAGVPLPLGLIQGMPGKHVITATAVYPGDVNPANDQLTVVVQVQFNGTYTIGAGPNTFPTLKMAADTLSFYGVCGSTTLNCIPGHTETSSEIIIRTTTTNASNTLTINGNGAIITAGTGTSTTVDGIIKIAGSDYVTIDGFVLNENPANTTATTQMEWGIALVKRSNSAPFNGCHYVTIRNCTISLNKANTNTFGIYLGNHIATATTSLTITDPADANSNNSIYNNFISNTYSGIRLGGYAASSPYTLYDQNNNVGGLGGNIIVNYGGGGSIAYGINTIYQNNLVIANDSINGGTGQTTTFYGIMVSTASWANTEIYNNKITLTSASTSSNTIGIYSTAGGSGTGNLTRIYNNEIKDCNYPSTSGAFTGIHMTTPYADTVRIYDNIIKNNTLGGTGIMTLIDGGAPNNLFMYDNQVFGNTKSGASGAFYCTRASTSKIEYFQNEIIQQ
jgi:trimeric autotransporter adhesin